MLEDQKSENIRKREKYISKYLIEDDENASNNFSITKLRLRLPGKQIQQLRLEESGVPVRDLSQIQESSITQRWKLS